MDACRCGVAEVNTFLADASVSAWHSGCRRQLTEIPAPQTWKRVDRVEVEPGYQATRLFNQPHRHRGLFLWRAGYLNEDSALCIRQLRSQSPLLRSAALATHWRRSGFFMGTSRDDKGGSN